MARPGRGSGDGWFRLGSMEFTTVVIVVALVIVSLVDYAVEPIGKPVQTHLLLDPDSVMNGQVWRLVTWPVAYPLGFGLFDILAVFFFWYFGNEIEAQLGKRRMLWFLGLLTVGLGLLWVVVVELLPFGYDVLYSLNQVQLMVLLTFIAEYPRRRFFFNIPGWVIAAVIIGLDVVNYLGQRNWLLLINLFLGLLLTAVLARSLGLLAELTWVPRMSLRRRTRTPKRPRRPGPAPAGGGTVVTGPWQPTPTPPVSRDQAALDDLLDKISASGMDSLTDAEREQLLILRDRLRRR
jgi:Family of unknown function (DUF6576)